MTQKEQFDAISCDILTLQTKLLAQEERERRLREALEATRSLVCSGGDPTWPHNTVHTLGCVCGCSICQRRNDTFRAALASLQEPQS